MMMTQRHAKVPAGALGQLELVREMFVMKMSIDLAYEHWARYEQIEVLVETVSGKEKNMTNWKGAKPSKNLFLGREQVSLKHRME